MLLSSLPSDARQVARFQRDRDRRTCVGIAPTPPSLAVLDAVRCGAPSPDSDRLIPSEKMRSSTRLGQLSKFLDWRAGAAHPDRLVSLTRLVTCRAGEETPP